MDIGIIGSGNIGSTAARLFAKAGHHVTIANSRGPESLHGLVDEIGPNAEAATVPDAAAAGDVVLVAIPFVAYGSLPADAFDGRIVVDANNYYAQRDGAIAEIDSDATTSTELLARHLPGARVVKGFNTMQAQKLASSGRPDAPRGERLAVLIAGDDAGAKATVAGLIDELGYAAVDTGSLAEGGRLQQPGAQLYGSLVTADEAERELAGA
jgi:predicted dinucleotide-binding enzyme